MRKEQVCCFRCGERIADKTEEMFIPVKTRTRFNLRENTMNVQCHHCYAVNYFKNGELLEDCEQRNNKYQLENSYKRASI